VLEDGRRLVAVDLATHLIRSAITFAKGSGIGDFASSLAIAPRGHLAYLGTFTKRTGTVAAVDLVTERVRAVIRGFTRPAAIAIAPGGRTAYVTDSARGDVVPIGLVRERKLTAPTLTARGALPGADAIAIAPDDRTAYVAGASELYSVNLVSRSIETSATSGLGGARDIAIDPNGTRIYVTSSGTGSVVPIDLATSTTRPVVSGLSSPQAIAVTIPPPHGDSVSIAGPLRHSATRVGLKLTCTSTTTACRAIATVIAGALVAGRATIKIPHGRTAGVFMRLDPSAREAVTRLGRLAAVLVLAIERKGHRDTVMTSSITIERSRGRGR
jgi:hypothetical protein